MSEKAAPLKPTEAKDDSKAPNAADKKKGKEKKEEEMSEEDVRLKEKLDLLTERLKDKEPGVQKLALETLRSEIKSSTSSMTSVPKALKFLRPHYGALKEFFGTLGESENKTLLADILSVLAMTMSEPDTRESLSFKLAGVVDDLGSWGHEFVRNLAGEIGEEFEIRKSAEKPVDDLLNLVSYIIPFYMSHNAEPDACDLLMEVEKLPTIIDHVDDKNYTRVSLYLLSCARYLPEPEDTETMRTVLHIYRKMNQPTDALRVAILLNDDAAVKDIFESCDDFVLKKQLAFQLSRQCIFNIEDGDDSINNILSNSHLNENFLALAKDLEVVEPKTPEDIYKSHLVETRALNAAKNPALETLASTFVNAFVNAGFGNDKLMFDPASKALAKHKDHSLMSAAASLGLILLWDVEGGLTKLDKYLYSKEEYVKAGALLAVGIVNSSVKNECDPARALLAEDLANPNPNIRIGAIYGLGLAYTGTGRRDLLEILTPLVEDSSLPMEVSSMAALAVGQIFVGTCDAEASALIVQALLLRDETALNSTHSRYMCLGLGLLFFGRQEAAEPTLEALKAIPGPTGQYAITTVDTCAYAGTGNVLKVQKLLGTCGDHLEKDNGFQAVAVLGIGLIASGEEIGAEMALRAFDHLLQYGEPVIRRAVPLALGLVSISNPRVTVMDTLSKFSHDSDAEVAMSAILALGLIGAGTNNSRIAGLLRQLVSYYYKDANHLFIVRVAQGLLHMGKGTMTLNPFHSHGLLMSRVAFSGLLVFLHSCLDIKNIILGKYHYMLYSLVGAIYPRMLMTFNEDLQPLQTPVRVGQAVDTVGQAGRPKTITGFQTHNTPVLLGVGERAELATDDYIPYTNVLEGFVILRKNPNAVPKTTAST